MIEVEDIVKRYGAVMAVNHVSFRVRQGEILGFLGPNGAGKTTTLKILTCFIVADSGKVRVAGYDVLEDSLDVRRSIGYLPESVPLYAEMRVGDYLEFIARARQIGAPRVRAAVDRVVQMVKIESMLKKNIGHLSKGYRQRVALAQALIHDPPILVLDEPTSGLDPHQIIEIRELLRELGKTKVIIFSSHILQEISAICTRIIIIKDGRLVADGTPEDLATQTDGQVSYRVRIDGPEAQIRDRLSRISGVASVAPLGASGDAHELRVIAPGRIAVAPEIFRAAAESGWTLSLLEPERRSLEEVYLRLTA